MAMGGLGATVRLRMIDDGRGVQAHRSGEGWLDLVGVRERMVSLGGTSSGADGGWQKPYTS
jgi:signal transduction histidine kinase